MPDKIYLKRLLGDTVQNVLLRLEADGVEIPEDLRGYKAAPRRDKREPARSEKEAAEDALMLFFMRRFRRQAKVLKERLAMVVKQLPIPIDDIFDPDDEDTAELMRQLLRNARGGITLFGQETGIDIDYTMTNVQAAEWAKKYAGTLIKDIDKLTLDAVRSAVEMFVNTPGFTIGDLMDLLPFDEKRALRVAVTEVTRSYSQGQTIAAEEMRSQFPDVRIVDRWFTNNDDLVCDLCGELDGQEIEFGETFYEPENDYQDGYPPRHVNCLPGDAMVLPIGRVAGGSKRWYEGDIVVIRTLKNQLTITPNHPILTTSGWVAAGSLIEGNDVISYIPSQEMFMGALNEQNRITSIENIFSSLSLGDFGVPVSPPDFHGDGANSEIAIIRANGKVHDRDIPQFFKPDFEQSLISGNVISFVPLSGLSAPNFSIEVNLNPPHSIVGGLDLVNALLGGHPAPPDNLSSRFSSGIDTCLEKSLSDSPAVDAVTLSDAVLALTGKVTIEKIIKIGKYNFFGHVYNLQTESNLFVADGIIAHNCRCWRSTSTALAEL